MDSRPLMSSRPAGRAGVVVLVALAIAAFAYCAVQVLEVSFLADDFFAGQGIAIHAARHPDVVDRIVTTFTKKWSDALSFWHRPMLALGVQADYALFGVDGRRHHLISLTLWVLVAASSSVVARRLFGPRARATPWVVFALGLLHPAGVEALCWLAARDDLMFAFFGLQTIRSRLARPRSVLAPIPWLALALFSKESASVLVPLLNVASLLRVGERPDPAPARTRIVLREAAPWILLAAWFGFRYRVLGGLGASYGPNLYFDNLGAGHIARNFAQSFLQLIAPVNATALDALRIPPLLVKALMLVPTGVLLALLIGGRKPGDGRRVLFLLAGISAPLLLLSPVFVVSNELNGSRGLVFPGACWVVLLGLAWDRARRWPAVRAIAISLLLVTASLSFLVAVTPYVYATQQAEGALRTLDAVPPGDTALLMRTFHPVSDMRPDTIMLGGAYVLSVGLHPAMGPPFRADPPVTIVMPQDDAALLAVPGDSPRPWIATLPDATGGAPRFQILARGGADGPAVEVAPRHGSRLVAGDSMAFTITADSALRARIASVRIEVADPAGNVARADIEHRDIAALSTPEGTVVIPALRVGPQGSVAALQAAKVTVLIWWAEARDKDGALVFRTPWQAVAVP